MRFVYLLLLWPYLLHAQSIQPESDLSTNKGWQALTISNGLSQGMVYDLKQDRQGFIWVATKDGLNRYDGSNFTVYTHDPYNDYSLSDNGCSALLLDKQGRLWVGTLSQGLNLFDEKTGRFYHIDISDGAASNAGNYEIRLLAEDPDGNIWVNTNKEKLFKITLSDALKTGYPNQPNGTAQVRMNSLSLPESKLNGKAQHIQFDQDGTATVGTNDGLFSFNWRRPAGVRAVYSDLFSWQGQVPTDHTAGSGYWFAATTTHLHTLHQGVYKSIGLDGPGRGFALVKFLDANTVAVANMHYVWLMTPEQLMRQDRLTARNAFARIPPNLFNVTKLMRDQSGMLWFGTAGYGLRVLNPRVKAFGAYLPTLSLSYLVQDLRGQTYVLERFRFKRVDLATNQLSPVLEDREGLHHRYLMQDRRGQFWMAYEDTPNGTHFLRVYSEEWKPLKTYPMPAGTAFGSFGNQMREDRAGNLWIGATNGKLVCFNPATETFRVFSYQHLLPQSGAVIETYALYFDGTGTGWIGTQKGLVQAQNLTTRPVFTLFRNSKTDRQSLSNDVVSCIIDDPYEPQRYLWVSTKGGGLEQLDKQSGTGGLGRFRHFTEAQGLPNKVVYGILADEFRNLWLSTNRGLAQFNPQTFRFRNYTQADGLQDDEFNTGSFAKGRSGELLFGGVNGLNIFLARNIIQKRSSVPKVHIIGLKINNEPVRMGSPDGILKQTIENTESLELSHQQNLLTLEFGVMDFTNPALNRYRYRMEGIDPNWVEAGTNRFANYVQLPDGQYTLHMMGSNDGETWSKPITLHIRVHPPFYRAWLAYLVYALVVAVIGWQLYRFQMQRLLLQQQVAFKNQEASRLAELDTLKTQFFTNISHEFRTPLTLILGPLTDLKRRLKTESSVTLTAPVVDLMERNSTRLLTLINQLLDLSKLEAGQLTSELEPGNMPVLFRTVGSSFESLAQSQQIRFSVDQTEADWWGLFDRDKLEKIVTNLLANAFKFTPAGNEVRLKVNYPTQSEVGPIRFTVTDTGIGIAPDQLARIFERFYQVDSQISRKYEGTGIGLSLVNELVRVLGGTITVNSAEGVGTSFRVMLPVTPYHSPSYHNSGPLLQSGEESNADSVALISEDERKAARHSFSPAVQREVAVAEGPGAEHENRLLIIDDNADIRSYVRSVFEGDYQILEAEDGKQGLELATTELPNLVICDLMMPCLDGFGFCKALKTGEITSHIPVVMLTAKATVADRIEGFELGADDYLTKPFNRDELRVRVRNLVEGRQRLFERFSTANPHPPTEPMKPAEPALLLAEQQFLDRLAAIVTAQLDNPDFTVEALAEGVSMSRSQLHRKLKALTNGTATDFVRDLRLARAADYLREGGLNVTQVAYAVGFDNLSYFAKVFQERYGVLPSQYSKVSSIQA